jgi:7,8-dihydropterin-6-yl-methyl-4-(beta-D-ribofuranosyl)aminobenzene 5'-phosphate synthase
MSSYAARAAISLLLCGLTAAHAQDSTRGSTFTILYDNTVFVEGTAGGWGFACLMQSGTDTVLFDAGASGTALLGNADTLGIDLSSTKRIVLSHGDYDHIAGLANTLALAPGIPVCMGAHFSADVVQTTMLNGGRPVFVTGPTEVSDGLYSTGELPSGFAGREQALVMESDSGLVVAIGCGHPGVVQILKAVREGLGRDIFAVFGGYHLLGYSQPQVDAIVQEMRKLGVRKCGAGHCTGGPQIEWIAQAFGADFLPMGVGRVLRFPASTVSSSGPLMWLSRGVIDFGDVELGGKPDTATLLVQNLTPRTLSVSEISQGSGAFELLGVPRLPIVVRPDTPLTLRAVFRPVTSEQYSDTIKVVSDDAKTPVRMIPVSGEGFVVAPALENSLYALGGQRDSGNVRIVDLGTGVARLVGPSRCAQIVSASVSASTGEIVALAPSGYSTSLVRLSASGGHFAVVAQWPSLGLKGMTFRKDTLYVARSSALYRWDRTLLTGTLVKSFPPQYVFSGLAYRRSHDDFLACVGGTGAAADSLYRIDPTTWTIAAVGPLGMKPVVDVVCDDAENLYGVLTPDSSESLLLRISPDDGAATVIGNMGAAGIMALAARGVVTGVAGTFSMPTEFVLSQNYPNPFNPSTTIEYALPARSHVTLAVFNTLGQRIAVLREGEQEPGYYEVRFDAGTRASGVYLYRLRVRPLDPAIGRDSRSGAGDFVQTKRLLLLK